MSHLPWVSILCLAGALAASIDRCLRALHMLQLDSYDNLRFMRWLFSDRSRLVDHRSTLLFALVSVVYAGLTLVSAPMPFVWVASVWTLGCLDLAVLHRSLPPAKKPLVFTGRAIRIMGLSLCVMGCAALLGYFSTGRQRLQGSSPFLMGSASLGLSWCLIQVAPFFVVVANLALRPIQALLNQYYVTRARRKLRRLSPFVVGITGSYGKTSTKYFAADVLGIARRVLKTPGSFNTLLGVSRVINDSLAREHELFIVEMGAYRRGEVADIAAMVRPRISVITAIGPQHLERFGSIEAIERAKYEIIDGLSDSGVAIFNYDDKRCARLADQTTRLKVVRYGVDVQGDKLDVWAENVEYSEKGLMATIAVRGGERFPIRVGVLGRHNLSNVLAAIAIAREVGLSTAEIARGCLAVRPAPHRLELLGRPDGAIVIDDSYNSNPVGAMNALDALSQFKTGSRILVTPGMVELGEEQNKWNEELGAKAAQTCDQVVLVGRRQTEPIVRGLDRAGFSASARFIARDLHEARRHLDDIVKRGDVILFENDLPDLYAES